MARTDTAAPSRQLTARSPSGRPAGRAGRYPRNAAPPVLAEVRRGAVTESRHRGHVVQVAVDGRIERGIGNPDVVVSLRSAVKPFSLLALLESGADEPLRLSDPELAVMTASHSGEDSHVRTLQGVLRRAGLTQSLLACGADGMPLDPLTAARLARDGEAPGPIRHMCSGFHVASLILARHGGWSVADYWRPEHPTQVAVRDVVGRVFGVKPSALNTAVDSCGLLTYAFPLADIARAYALLAAPDEATDPARRALAPHLRRIRDAMTAAPEMVGGTRDSADTMTMRARPGLIVAKGGAEGLRGIGLLAGARGADTAAAGVAVKIEDGDSGGRANRAVTVEALGQLGVFDGAALERLSDLHRPPLRDPRGVEVGQVATLFELAPISELV
jgi:L-asparaginase II